MQNTTSPDSSTSSAEFSRQIKTWATELGFQQCGICEADPRQHAEHYLEWLEKNYHGKMAYMEDRKSFRLNPAKLLPNTLRVISLRMDYRERDSEFIKILDDSNQAYIAEYALGRDYHKLMRKRLAQLSKQIESLAEKCSQRPFVDSAPVLERGFAQQAGLGWIGKNTMLINSTAGSWFFLGEILTDLPLHIDQPHEEQHCGSCTACLEACPTNAFSEEHVLDARKCISYLTIESRDSIPIELREAMGNRVFGCDDCQIVCPWNKFSEPSSELDFKPRNRLDKASLLELFLWTEEEFDEKTRGSPIRRIGYECWLRNLAIGLGNSAGGDEVIKALKGKQHHSPLVNEHVQWALKKLGVQRS